MSKDGLKSFLASLREKSGTIPSGRKETFFLLGDAILKSLSERNAADLVFICTHNSRRSQFGQAWARYLSRYLGINNIRTFSGGTETTEFNPMAVAALERAGFSVSVPDQDITNPHYFLSTGDAGPVEPMYSKVFDDPGNPWEGFIAVMVCSDADEACPFIPGASHRISLPYRDPKEFDGTALEKDKYDDCCRQIAAELYFLFQYLQQKVIQITTGQ